MIIINKMGIRIFCLFLFIAMVSIIVHRDRCIRDKTVHTQAEPIQLSISQMQRPHYSTGAIDNVELPAVPLSQLMNRKKVNSFIFNHYNQYRFEFTFSDLGYSSNLVFQAFTEDIGSIHLTERIGFDLSEKILEGEMNLNFKKKNFNLTVHQYIDQENQFTVTVFNLTLKRSKIEVVANLTHIIRNKQCLTAIRNADVISHKCFGGMGEGKIRIDKFYQFEGDPTRKNSVYHPSFNVTKTAFNGLRGSGMHWQWLWGLVSGFSKPEFYSLNHTIPKERFITINFGNLDGEGEDMVFLNEKAYPVKGMKYVVRQDYEVGVNITLTADLPRINANFTILSKNHLYKDYGLSKLDFLRFDGYWAGQIEDEDGNPIQFYLIAGHIQLCNSLF